MGLTPEMHKNVKRDTFTAGHMVYIDNDSLINLKNDVDEFYSNNQRLLLRT